MLRKSQMMVPAHDLETGRPSTTGMVRPARGEKIRWAWMTLAQKRKEEMAG